MRTLLSLFWLFIFFISSASAGEDFSKEKYRASTLTADIKKNAHAVLRYDSNSFKVFSLRKAVKKVHQVITILDPDEIGRAHV